MSNLELYEKFRSVPEEAKKPIGGGRLKGMTDINPMWRIKALTEAFGACGDGWTYEVTDRWTEKAGEEIIAFVQIALRYRTDEKWSEPVIGSGGAMLYVQEKGGMRANDEAYKMATTDAISVACKQLGFGADVYWAKDRTKYDAPNEEPTKEQASQAGYPSRDEMMKIILERYPDGSKVQKALLASNNLQKAGDMTDAQVMSVYNHIMKEKK